MPPWQDFSLPLALPLNRSQPEVQPTVRKPYLRNKGWYPEKKDEILPYLASHSTETRALSFAMVPHAGWLYSGKTAGKVYASLPLPDIAIFLATNHTGLGTPSSIFPEGQWEMPLGEFEVEQECVQTLLKNSTSLKTDREAHLYEHAIEVQLPFLQVLQPKAKIVAIEMRDYRIETCQEIARALAKTIETIFAKNPRKKFWVIASSDMTHCGEMYGQIPPAKMSPDAFARKQDSMAIEKMQELDAEGLLQTVKKNNVTMCGSGPAAAVMETAKMLGAKKGELLSYATSCDVSGKDSDLAVGYAGMVFR